MRFQSKTFIVIHYKREKNSYEDKNLIKAYK